MFRFGSDDISVVSAMLLKYIRLPRWDEQRSLAAIEAFGDPGRFTETMHAARASTTCEEAFLSWFTFERPLGDRGSLLIDRFLKDEPGDLTRAQRAYLDGLRKSCLRPYEILAGDDRHDPAILCDMWNDDLVPLGGPARARGSRGSGTAFVRLMLGTGATPTMAEALALPRAVMKELLLVLRLMHQDFSKKTPDLSEDRFFKGATPWMLGAWLKSFAPPRKVPPGRRVMQVKVVLDGIRPQIWRRLLVPEGITLTALSAALERAMGWESYHLHEFDIDGVAYGVPDLDYPRPVHAERDRRISDFDFEKGAVFYYRYDFGDGWRHRAIIEKFLEPEPGVAYPVCVDGARACPPEDVGGPGGYRDYLKIMRNPRHREHGALKQWGRRKGRDVDPERFDPAELKTRDCSRSSE